MKINIKEIGCENVRWMQLSQNRTASREFVSYIRNMLISRVKVCQQ
jgi:hypothetical protein